MTASLFMRYFKAGPTALFYYLSALVLIARPTDLPPQTWAVPDASSMLLQLKSRLGKIDNRSGTLLDVHLCSQAYLGRFF